MDQRFLVEDDIARGRKLADLLRKEGGTRVEAAFWWQENDEWRYIVATPIVHERGRLAAHEKIRKAVGANAKDYQTIMERLDVLSPSEGLISVLDIGSGTRIPLNRQIFNEGVQGVFVPGAYFYYFAPRTFAPA